MSDDAKLFSPKRFIAILPIEATHPPGERPQIRRPNDEISSSETLVARKIRAVMTTL